MNNYHTVTLAPGAHGGQGAHLRLSHLGLSARTGSLVVVDNWSGIAAPPLVQLDRAGCMVRRRGCVPCAPSFAIVVTWVQQSGRRQSSRALYDNTPGCGSSPQPGMVFRRCNSCLHLPPSTTYLPLFGWMGFCFWGVLAKMLVFHGLQGAKCCHLTPKDTECQMFPRNGVQEASSSNLDTRTKKTEAALAVSVFYLCSVRFEPSKCNSPGACCSRRLDGAKQ